MLKFEKSFKTYFGTQLHCNWKEWRGKYVTFMVMHKHASFFN